MKFKRITKATFEAFINALTSECEAAGIKQFPSRWNCDRPCYQILTSVGLYQFRAMEPFGEPRLTYDITVFGRFEDEKAASHRVGCNPHSGKWNWHAGYVTEPEAIAYAKHIVTRILSV